MPGETAGTIGKVTGDVKGGLLALAHFGDTLVPALDDLANANGDDEVTATDRRVELFALGAIALVEPASVLNGDLIAIPGDRTGALRDNSLCDTHCLNG